MAYNYQKMMHTSVQTNKATLCTFHTFWPKKTNFLKNKNDTWRFYTGVLKITIT